MKERYIPTPIISGPTKDLKISTRFLGTVAKSVIDETKPVVYPIAQRMAENVLRKILRK